MQKLELPHELKKGTRRTGMKIPGGMPCKGYSGNSLRLHRLFSIRHSYDICLRPPSSAELEPSLGIL